ncbi:MAG: Phosphate import ATP-binding protein PstB 3 [Firmicutes bacterium]|nr:Phosphate import ATP-binding protein PstB 3 [candidate division NPL-UPA2 bacterium]MBT9154746.1 Phosphate import ATP-binding protein PstB 3 [candidate division NPL-UPA2 bacterium]MBT9155689.1 Phosphate import ATP-binding protein PstB 3 [candidate division NPL-UPA2 bacterium]
MAQGVNIENYSFWYGRTQVVKNISLSAPVRQVTALIGPSGCGKTTLLRSINRLHELHPGTKAEGRIAIGEEDIFSAAVDPVDLRRRVGMIFQKPSPFPHLSVFENVAAGLRLHGLAQGKEVAERVEACLRKAALWEEVKDDLGRKGALLSGGQQQRLCIARALAVEPEVFLMDEPCASLDPVGTMRIEELIRELKHDYTVVIVTHNMHQASRISDQTAFVLSGELVEVGRTKEFFLAPQDPRTEAYLTWKIG